MILAEFEVFHSRNYSPTRRLALGYKDLPADPPPGFGPLLLGGVVAVGAEELDEEDVDALLLLMTQLEHGQRVVQPRVRNRFQSDKHGLARTVGRLIGGGEQLEYDFDGSGSPLQMALAATYAAGQFPFNVRPRVFDVLRAGLRWKGPIGPSLISHLSGGLGAPAWSVAAYLDPNQWALDLLGFGERASTPSKREVQRIFRKLVRDAHPDHGAETEGAAQRIAELTEARRILLG
ncbi:MAG TPA: J domain-containing protein [Acidimicrobiales bacterium]|nr:J domain-containing protein [Acidimicrobiales bacterium]